MSSTGAELGATPRARWKLPTASGLLDRAPGWWPVAAITALLSAGAVVLAQATSGTTFWADEWEWILARRGGGIGTLLDPHNSHLSVVPIAIYKVLLALVGLRHYWLFRAVLIAADIACVLLVFVYVRRRSGDYPALLAAALILFFGPGWQDILWPFQMAWMIAIGAGIGALLALDRDTRRGDIVACALLGLSLSSAGPGLAVAVGVILDVALCRGRRGWWIPALPIGLYALWALGYQEATTNRHAFALLPRFVFDSAAGVLSSLAGLAAPDVYHDSGTFLPWGAPLVVAAAAGIAWRLRRGGRLPPRALSLLGVLLGFWILTGIGRAYVPQGAIVLTASGDESRYLYVGAVFAVLLAADVVGRRPWPLQAYVLTTVLVLASVVSNISTLRAGSGLLRSQARDTAAELASLDLDRSFVSPKYVSNGFIFGIVTAGQWFSAERDLGSPAPGPPATVLAGLPDDARAAADAQLINIQSLALRPYGPPARTGPAPAVDSVSTGTATRSAGCVEYRPSVGAPSLDSAAITLTVPSGGVVISAGPASATVTARRFSTAFQPLGALPVGGRGVLAPRADPAPQPWHLRIAAAGPFSVCGRT